MIKMISISPKTNSTLPPQIKTIKIKKCLVDLKRGTYNYICTYYFKLELIFFIKINNTNTLSYINVIILKIYHNLVITCNISIINQ